MAFLTDDQRTFIEAVADAYFHPVPMVIPARDVAARADELLETIDSDEKSGVVQALDALEHWAPLFVTGQPRKFSALDRPQRQAVLGGLVDAKGILSPIARDIARVVRLLVAFPYYSDARVKASLGYVPFEQRPRAAGLDKTPLTFRPPDDGG